MGEKILMRMQCWFSHFSQQLDFNLPTADLSGQGASLFYEMHSSV